MDTPTNRTLSEAIVAGEVQALLSRRQCGNVRQITGELGFPEFQRLKSMRVIPWNDYTILNLPEASILSTTNEEQQGWWE